MPHNYTKRIKNTIRKDATGYHLTTSHLFVPNKGSKKTMHGTEVHSMQNTIIIYGTPPALKNLKDLYETALSDYYKTMYGHKKLKKKFNRHYKAVV